MSVITTEGFVALEDDKTRCRTRPCCRSCAPRSSTTSSRATLDAVNAELDTDVLKELMVQVEVDAQAPDVVAEEWLATLSSGRRPSMIEIRDLTKRFGRAVAVDDLTFDVHPGRVTGFLGPNGSGKSTTMRCMLGLDRPERAHPFAGRRFESFAPAAARDRRPARRRLRAPRSQRSQPPALAGGEQRAADGHASTRCSAWSG